MRRAMQLLMVFGVMAAAQVACAQWGGRDKRGGGRDDNRAMSPDEIKMRLSRTEEALNNIDVNHNGMIDSDEASSDRSKDMIDRIFRDAPSPPHFPMAIKDILQMKETAYKNRGNGAPPSGSPSSGSTASSASNSSGGTPSGLMGFGTLQPTSAGSASSTMVSPPGMGFGPPPSSGPSSGSPSPGSTGGGRSWSPWGAPPGSSSSGSGTSASPSTAASTVKSSLEASSDVKSPVHKSGRFLTARERLPKGLPTWFTDKDVNGDGQITMDEYATIWTADKAAEFDKYDLNHDGIITAEECLKVEKKGSSVAHAH